MRTETVRVDTHSAMEMFAFSQWEDRSPPASVLHFLSVLLLARLRTYKIFQYSPRAWMNRQQQYAYFIRCNDRDTHYDD